MVVGHPGGWLLWWLVVMVVGVMVVGHPGGWLLWYRSLWWVVLLLVCRDCGWSWWWLSSLFPCPCCDLILSHAVTIFSLSFAISLSCPCQLPFLVHCQCSYISRLHPYPVPVLSLSLSLLYLRPFAIIPLMRCIFSLSSATFHCQYQVLVDFLSHSLPVPRVSPNFASKRNWSET